MSTINYLNISTVNRYSKRLKKIGYDVKTLGWSSTDDQRYRFDQVLRLLPTEIDSLVDIGCGFGDFLDHINVSHINCKSYEGWDVNKYFIDYSNQKYQKTKNAKFFVKDILKFKEKTKVASHGIILGLLNFNWKDKFDNLTLTKKMISKAFSIVEESLIVDFLSVNLTKSYPKEEDVFYHDPGEILNFCLTLSNNVHLIHDYSPIPQKEFMISLRKD